MTGRSAADAVPAGVSEDVPVSSGAGPIAADARIHALDILRGLALFGMILVHFHQKMRLEASGLEDLIGWGVYLFVEQKAWGTFAFLFGVGFAVLLRRLEARRAPVVAIYTRRLAALAGLGVVAEVGFGFHILFTYACWGFALLVVRHWSTRALLWSAVAAAAARPVVAELNALWVWWTSAPPVVNPARELMRAAGAAAANGDYLSLLDARWALFLATTPGRWQNLLPDVNVALFLIGLLAVRHGVLDEPLRHVRLIAGWMIFGVTSWVLAWTVLPRFDAITIPGAGWPLAYGLGLVQDQWLSFFYIGAVVLCLAKWPVWTSRLAFVGRAGRMALTNYMVQIVILDVLASGYGVGLKLRPFAYVPAAMLLFAFEVVLSTVWLARFRFGPLEWMWRAVTYAHWPPLRRGSGI